jgi:hypothetical protein
MSAGSSRSGLLQLISPTFDVPAPFAWCFDRSQRMAAGRRRSVANSATVAG